MLLCIDTGNTNTVFSVWDGEKFLTTLRTATEHQRTADQYFVWFSTLMEHHGLEVDIDEVIISSTVPRVVFNLRVLSPTAIFNCRPLVVGKPDCLLPAPPRVDRSVQVGPDRLVNTAGAFDRHGGDLIVVDFGTATTFDVVSKDGAYIGGVIAPGRESQPRSAAPCRRRLAACRHHQAEQVIGTNTVACMQSGVFWGYVGLVRGICDRILAGTERPMKIIGTGGLAPLFAQGDVLFDVIEDDLTMHGLTVIHRYNKEHQ